MRGTSRELPIVVSPSPNRSHEQMRGSSDDQGRLRPATYASAHYKHALTDPVTHGP